MTDPASAIRRQVDELIEAQISTLKQSSSLTSSELTEYHGRSAKISKLFAELDRSKTLPPYPNRRHHPSLFSDLT